MAAAEPRLTVVVHVQNMAKIRESFLAGAQRQATRIFGAAGVDLVWAAGSRTGHERRITLTIVAGRRAEEALFPRRVIGLAMRGADLVYVHAGRVEALALARGVIPATLLGNAIAHELGHILLPVAGHSDSGLMIETLNVATPHGVAFAPGDAAAIRATLASRPEAVVTRLR